MPPPLLLLLFLLPTPPIATTTPPPPPPPRFACEPPRHSAHPFCNTSLPIPLRAKSLVSLLTLWEKTQLLSNDAAAVPRLGVPAYQWWSESLHGLAANGPGVVFSGGPVRAATTFPQVILSAASFNRSLWASIAAAIAVEARAMHNSGQAGLTFWAPNINVFRDPRWGRGQETPGEDPLLASAYAAVYAVSFQGEYGSGDVDTAEWNMRVLEQESGGGGGGGGGGGESRMMLSACCKHYTAYDLEKWGNFTRYTFNAKVTEQDMEDTYQPPFKSCVREGRASCLMCSYNAVDGVPLCASRDLLQKARDEWGFRGYITSDCNAVATIYEYQNYTQNPIDAVADALKAGVDINCGGYYSLYAEPAVQAGKIKESDIDQALFNLFSVQLRLGWFDGDAKSQKFGALGPSDVCSAEHRHLALEAARQGIVLLKNDRDSLPLGRLWSSGKIKSVAVIGPVANNGSYLGGDYTGIACSEKSVVEGIRERFGKVAFAPGCADVECRSADGIAEAVRVAGEADVVVVVAGLDSTQEREDFDRTSLLLPGKQAVLVASVARASRRPAILVLVGGGPVDVSFAEEDPRVGSILWVGYPGEAGATAIAEAIMGDFNPGGRLPMTWYPESFTAVPMSDMNMRADRSRGYPGRTYRFYEGPAVYQFGHGLSYSNYTEAFLWAPDRISLSKALASAPRVDGEPTEPPRADDGGLGYVAVDQQLEEACESLKFSVHVFVKNEGEMDGSRAVLLFARFGGTRLKGAPLKQLIGFERVQTLAAGKATRVAVAVEPCEHLSFADERGRRVLPLGPHLLTLGSGAERYLTIEV